jgi:hypothetical protein
MNFQTTTMLLAAIVALASAQTDAEKCAKLCTFGPDEDRSKCWVLGAVPTNLGNDLIYWKSANQSVIEKQLLFDRFTSPLMILLFRFSFTRIDRR